MMPNSANSPAPRVIVPSTPTETAEVRFNGDEIIKTPNGLYYPPIIRDAAAVVYAEYFPKFLIDLVRDGDSIRLQGKLKDKGKTALLKIGEKKAQVDGKEVTLSSEPVMVNDRLYLPSELLQLTNGIQTRWELKKKLLRVDTRYLWRD
jgi:transketolase C-terminal domain/subunit